MPGAELCVIYNPVAGRGRALRRLEALRRDLAGRAEFLATGGPGHAERLALDVVSSGCTLIGAAGGDGTVHEVANGLLRAGRPEATLAVFPIGSANDYAYSLGLAADWWRRPAEVTRRQVDVGRVTRPDGRQRYFVNGMGLGINCAVTLEARKLRWLQGLPLYTLALLKVLRSRYASPTMSVALDSITHVGPTLALTLAIGPREGAFLLAPKAIVDDGMLDYLHVGPLPRRRLIAYLPRMIAGRLPHHDPLVRMGRCREVRVHSEAPLTIHCDGEFFYLAEEGLCDVEVHLLPGALAVQAAVARP